MRPARILALPLLLTLASPAFSQSWTPDAATIAKLESTIREGDINWGPLAQYPSGHAPVVSEYSRFYAGYLKAGHKMIHGEFVESGWIKSRPAGLYIVSKEKNLPEIDDGGCGVVNVIYAVETGQIISIKCNGRA